MPVTFEVEDHDGLSVGVVTISRPERRNAIDHTALDELHDCVRQAAAAASTSRTTRRSTTTSSSEAATQTSDGTYAGSGSGRAGARKMAGTAGAGAGRSGTRTGSASTRLWHAHSARRTQT